MARIDNLSNFLTDVATAIKAKTGTAGTIPASSFDTEIAKIETNTKNAYKVASETAMNALTDMEDGDCCTVAEEGQISMTADMTVENLYFPTSVVLNEAISTESYVILQQVGGTEKLHITLTSTEFEVMSSTVDLLDVKYVSTDGLTYTLQGDITDVNLNAVFKITDATKSSWVSVLGEFIKTDGTTLTGIYEYDGSKWNKQNIV